MIKSYLNVPLIATVMVRTAFYRILCRYSVELVSKPLNFSFSGIPKKIVYSNKNVYAVMGQKTKIIVGWLC